MGKKGEVVGDVELGRILGVGGFGQVRLGIDKKNDQPVAVKFIDKYIVKQNKLESYVKREVDMLRKIQHAHVVCLLRLIETRKGYYLVMELAPNGELFDKIVESKRFTEGTARAYFQQLMSAVVYCHRKDIVHRDLKAENLLLGKDGELKVCDFGLSRYVMESKNKDHPVLFTSLAGSTDYQAPEVIKTDGYHGFTCDVWSCGVILFFMLCGYLPFAAREEKETRNRILNGAYNKKDRNLTPGAADLISKILVVDPNARFGTKEIINHPWFVENLDPSLFPDGSVTSPKVKPTISPSGEEFFQEIVSSPTKSGPPQIDAAQQQLALLKSAFSSCNVHKNGLLNKDEVRDVLIKLNKNEPVQESEVDDLWKYFISANPDAPNTDGESTTHITEEQFISGWMQNSQHIESKLELSKLIDIFHIEVEHQLLAELRKAFNTLDVDRSGIITPENITALPELDVTKEEAEQLIDTMDLTKTCASGLTFEDFIVCATKCDLLTRHPLGRRLKRVEKMFDVFETYGMRTFITTGFTVAGLREVIFNKICKEQDSIQTIFRQSDDDTSLYVYGTYKGDGQNRGLEIGVQLLPAVTGYTKVLAYRINGKTEVFHDWYFLLRKILRPEILQCEEDTFPVGESELM